MKNSPQAAPPPGIAILLAACLTLAPGCRPQAPGTPTEPPPAQAATTPLPAPPPPDAELLEVGRQIVSQSVSLLGSNLLAALGRTNPSNALEFCSVNAGPILESPDDAAHGFRLHEIRGLWSVTFPAR